MNIIDTTPLKALFQSVSSDHLKQLLSDEQVAALVPAPAPAPAPVSGLEDAVKAWLAGLDAEALATLLTDAQRAALVPATKKTFGKTSREVFAALCEAGQGEDHHALVEGVCDFLTERTGLLVVDDVDEFLQEQDEYDLKCALQYAHCIEFFASDEHDALCEIDTDAIVDYLREEGWVVSENDSDALSYASNDNLIEELRRRIG